MSKLNKGGIVEYSIVVDSTKIQKQLDKATSGWRIKLARVVFRVGAWLAGRKITVTFDIRERNT